MSCGLRRSERFTYEDNFFAAWLCDLRVAQFLGAPPGQGRAYPRCTGGRRAGPPEDWRGPFDYLERTQPYPVFDTLTRTAEIVQHMLDAADEDDLADVGVDREELAGMLPLLGLQHFDRRRQPRLADACSDRRGKPRMKLSVQVIVHPDDDTDRPRCERCSPSTATTCLRTPFACG